MKQKISSGFSLIEILVVIVIISMLVTIGSVSYQSINKDGRDARRKADLEQIRGALELYRSNNGVYPTSDPSHSFGMAFGTGGIVDATNTYMSKIPQDPRSSQSYYYGVSSGDYVIFAKLEGSSSCSDSVITDDCEQTTGIQACNYCLGPYGQK